VTNWRLPSTVPRLSIFVGQSTELTATGVAGLVRVWKELSTQVHKRKVWKYKSNLDLASLSLSLLYELAVDCIVLCSQVSTWLFLLISFTICPCCLILPFAVPLMVAVAHSYLSAFVSHTLSHFYRNEIENCL
jgi:hypothetical protein